MSNFHSLEVVGLGIETQLQVSGNLNYKIIEFCALKVNIHPLSATLAQ